MQLSDIFREVTPLSAEDCFVIRSRVKSEFNYPVHVHPEFELNYIENAAGAQRVIGDSMQDIGDYELCLIGNENLEHAWMNGKCSSKEIFEITIQFHKNLFFESLLSKRQFRSVNIMFENAKKGIAFSRDTILAVKEMLHNLCTAEGGFHSVIDLLKILQILSEDKNPQILATSTFVNRDDSSDSRRIQKVIDYLHANFQNEIHLLDVAKHVNMSEVAFSRFMKRRTGKNYIEYLTDLRLGIASRLLINTSKSIAEISFECGFNNLSNFNRMFKKRKAVTPKEFRENYSKMRILI